MVIKSDRRESLSADLLAGTTVVKPLQDNRIYHPHGLTRWVCNITVAGQGRVNPGEEQFIVRPGDLLLFAPGTPWDCAPLEEPGEWTRFWVSFNPRPSWHDLLHWPKATGGVRRLGTPVGKTRDRILSTFGELVDLYRSPLPRRHAMVMNLLESILLWCDTLNPSSAHLQIDRRVRKAMSFVCTSFAQTINLDHLARHCGLSSSRLSYLFREQVGMPPRAYVETQRLSHARELLLMTEIPIAAVAAKAGFKDPLYFTRIFKRHMGESPSRWRRKARGSAS
jgi:AraC family transcriptional regulator of arabinose operon